MPDCTAASSGGPLLPPGERLLLAVSGGQDSLCLLKLILDLRRLWHWPVAIAHCNHQWRADATANADQVAALAQQWGVPFHGLTADPPPRSEADARNWRYSALRELCEHVGYPYLVTGHTASDRAETLLHHLVRGSSIRGLGSLVWSRALSPQVQLVRPLLELTRQETAAFCQTFALPVWPDSTNADLRYTRNRLRQEILGPLRQAFNSQVDRHLAQTADLLAAEDDWLEQQVSELRPQIQQGNSLLRHPLAQFPLALQRRILWAFLQESLQHTPRFEQVEALRDLLSAPNRSRSSSLGQGMTAIVEGDRLRLQSPLSEGIPSTDPGSVDTTADAPPADDSAL